MIVFNWSKLRDDRGLLLLVVDLSMIGLVIVNLTFIIAEWHFSFEFVRNVLQTYLPVFHDWYDSTLHRNFLRYDIWFVSVFIIEFLVRWFFAVYHNRHHKWFFYPFLHWYDVLGCVPLGSFRFLRIFRVASMVLRLHKMGVVDLRQSYFWRIFDKYRAVVVEEISDRVVVNVLEGVQDELKQGNPVVGKILNEVLRPQKEFMAQWLSHRIRAVGEHNYEHHSERLRQYVNRKVADAVRGNKEVRDIASIPLVGSTITGKLEKAVAEITFAVIHGIMLDMKSEDSVALISELADVTMDLMLVEEQDGRLNEIALEMVHQSIEIIKDQVKVKQWQMKEDDRMAGPVEQ
ncbi:MAG: ion transporter [Flavobacteriales bacterium]|nr:ion transporter [Flavobacteriales bacterium]